MDARRTILNEALQAYLFRGDGMSAQIIVLLKRHKLDKIKDTTNTDFDSPIGRSWLNLKIDWSIYWIIVFV